MKPPKKDDKTATFKTRLFQRNIFFLKNWVSCRMFITISTYVLLFSTFRRAQSDLRVPFWPVIWGQFSSARFRKPAQRKSAVLRAVDVDMGVVHLPKVCAVKSLPKKEISLVNLVFFQRPKIEVCMSAHHTRFNIQPRNALIGKHLPCTKRDMWQGRASNKMKKVAGFTLTWRQIYDTKKKSQKQAKTRKYNRIWELFDKKTYVLCRHNS